jgi:hypothetical protein
MIPPFRREFDAAQNPLTAANALRVQPGVHVVSAGAAVSAGASISASLIVGITSGASAAAGIVGQYVESIVASSSSISSGTAGNVTSISLLPGEYDVGANAMFTITGNVTQTAVCVNTTSATMLTAGQPGRASPPYASAAAPIINSPEVNVTPRRVSLSSAGSAFLVVLATTTSSATARGSIWARRVG